MFVFFTAEKGVTHNAGYKIINGVLCSLILGLLTNVNNEIQISESQRRI
jgi:hypothetical protein